MRRYGGIWSPTGRSTCREAACRCHHPYQRCRKDRGAAAGGGEGSPPGDGSPGQVGREQEYSGPAPRWGECTAQSGRRCADSFLNRVRPGQATPERLHGHE